MRQATDSTVHPEGFRDNVGVAIGFWLQLQLLKTYSQVTCLELYVNVQSD